MDNLNKKENTVANMTIEEAKIEADIIRRIFGKLTCSKTQCSVTVLEAGEDHKPTRLEKGEIGVYVFLNNKKCFKVGKAGITSQPRWSSQHYNLDISTPSTFSKSLLNKISDFSKYFDGKAKEDLLEFARIINKELPKDFMFKKSVLAKLNTGEKKSFYLVKDSIPIKQWIQNNTSRIEFKIPYDKGKNKYALDLLEKLVAYRFKPLYEG